jgi:hypothetical protein
MVKRRRGERFYCQFFLIAVGMIFSISSYGQDVCSQQLEAAQRQFNEGRFYNVEPLISDCLKSGFTKQERISALELLALTKLYLDEMAQADSVYLDLLRQDPERKVNELVDPPDLIFLHNHFRTKPVFYWSIIGGINFTSPAVIHNYSVFDDARINEQSKARLGFEGGLNIEFNVYKDIYVGGAILFRRRNFLYTDEAKFFSPEPKDGFKISHIEANNYISLPVVAKYLVGQERIRPYFYGGINFDLLMFASHGDLVKISPFGEDPIEITSQDITSYRNPVNLSALIGIGCMIKSNGLSLIALDLKIEPGLTNITKESRRYADQGNLITTGYVHDAMRLNSISFSVRFVRPFYNPKLIKYQ